MGKLADMAAALADFDVVRFGRLNREFHQLLCSRCDYPRLNDLVVSEWARVELIRRSAFWYAPGRAQASLAEHDGILDLTEAGADADVIETAAREHEINTAEAVVRYDAELSLDDRRREGARPVRRVV